MRGRPSLRKSGCECAASQPPDLPELEASSCFGGAWSPLLLAIDEPSVREPCAIAHLPDARRLVHLLLSEVHYEVGVPRPPAAAAFKYRVGWNARLLPVRLRDRLRLAHNGRSSLGMRQIAREGHLRARHGCALVFRQLAAAVQCDSRRRTAAAGCEHDGEHARRA